MSRKETTATKPKVFLDKRGKPSYVIVPWERFKKLSPQEAEGLDIITDKELSSELKNRVRSHLSKKDLLANTIPLEKLLNEV